MLIINKRVKRFTVYFTIAFCINQFLFLIDEGYNDLRWMKSARNWIVFTIYMAFLLAFMLLADLFVLRFYKGKGQILIGSLSGVLLLLAVVFAIARFVAY